MVSTSSSTFSTASRSTQSTLIGDRSAFKSVSSNPSTIVDGLPPVSDGMAVGSEVPAVIPPPKYTGSGRTLILCFDGTGDQFNIKNSNIIELFTILKKDDQDRQMCYYQAGIGTYMPLKSANPIMMNVSKILDLAVAWDLDAHVMDGYTFLMQNYKFKDRICLFGFSRGAYTARALAGMIHKVGLLPADNHQQVPFAYKMYADKTQLGWDQSTAFKKAFSIDVQIQFIGVWDTVSSVGIFPRTLPFTWSNTIVRTFRQALSLDERRARFQPNFWHRRNEKEGGIGMVRPGPGHGRVVFRNPSVGKTKGVDVDGGGRGGGEGGLASPGADNGSEDDQDSKLPKKAQRMSTEELEREHSERIGVMTDAEEVWFAGAHCDVGGGSVNSDESFTLARISLRWMVRECFKTKTGIMFLSSGLYNIGLDPSTLHPSVLPRPSAIPTDSATTTTATAVTIATAVASSFHSPPSVVLSRPSEEEHELWDAISPIHDQLDESPMWWILEMLPLLQRRQVLDNTWEVRRINLGRGREFPILQNDRGKGAMVVGEGVKGELGKVKVHRSVKMRMEAKRVLVGRRSWVEGEAYKSKAPLQEAIARGRILWVD